MRRRFFALGYVFFILLTVTGLIMAFSFFQRLTNSNIVNTSELIDRAMSDTASIKADPAFVIENIQNDLSASLDNFHFYPEVNFVKKAHRSNCLTCHTPMPHNKNTGTRAFLNMHGGFIACGTCHSDGAKGSYQWYDVERKTLATSLVADVPLMAIQMVKVVAGKPGYVGQNNPKSVAQLTADVINDSKQADALCKTEFRNKLEQALNCDNCHSSKAGLLNWKKLGYTPERADKLATLSIPNVFQKYDEFYIPSF